MVTIAADLTALAGLATTNTGLTASNGDKFKLEDEVVEFARYQPGIRPDSSWEYATPADPTKIILRRGRDRTLAVPHAAGTTLVPASDAFGAGGGGVSVTDGTTTVASASSLSFPPGTVADLGGGIAGVGLVIQLLGPFALAFDTAGLVSPFFNGIEVAQLVEGDIVVSAWAASGDTWVTGGVSDPYLQIAIGQGDSGGLTDVVYLDLGSGNGTWDILPSAIAGHGLYVKQQIAGAGQALVAAVYTATGTPSGGTAGLYVLIATSAP